MVLRGGFTTSGRPTYWGSWKGQIIQAIVKNGPLTWTELKQQTGLDQEALNRALSEMYRLDQIYKTIRGKHRLCHELYEEYSIFLTKQSELGEIKTPEADQRQKPFSGTGTGAVEWINRWKILRNLDFSLESKHFFLDDMNLDDISKQLILRAKKEALVVNPFIESCSLSKTLEEASKHKVNVTVITRPPKRDESDREKEEYHSRLKKQGINLVYNKQTHAKLIVIDDEVAIVSSMNFYSSSSGGKTWEAGIVSTDEKVVKSVANSIRKLQKSS